jgi:hypothetical protein
MSGNEDSGLRTQESEDRPPPAEGARDKRPSSDVSANAEGLGPRASGLGTTSYTGVMAEETVPVSLIVISDFV